MTNYPETMKHHRIFLFSLLLTWMSAAQAQELKSNYIDWGYASSKFASALDAWQPGQQVSEDDNFFISRVKPKTRFRNQTTQVNPQLDSLTDKHLICWLPVDVSSKNALPDGVYDSEVFSMWPYVTHWGDWSAPLGRIPGALLDVAHKNGVAVSGVAGIPYGTLSKSSQWYATLDSLTKIGASKTADFLHYYGNDGLGYNSEFTNTSIVAPLRQFHGELVALMRPRNPLFENIWYDGTNDKGRITFDNGLWTHNSETFGDSANVRTSLFLNYNWNNKVRMERSVQKAIDMGRDPLDLYCGVNLQGGEPAGNSWTLIGDYRLSIGLWGAHTENMFWQSRGEKGSDPAVKQRTYMLRTERWFTGGTRNPANTPATVNTMKYNADNFAFHGMSRFMTARSSLSWNLAEEPFVTHFNLGNGTFLNWKGVRQNDLEWYNIGVQDYLPTWRWWWAGRLLGNTADDVPADGLDAEFTWDDAYMGGSTVRIWGSAPDEYLHLFKTDFPTNEGDIVTFKYKLTDGSANVGLVLTAVGKESVPLGEEKMELCSQGQEPSGEWQECTFVLGREWSGQRMALVALHFEEARDINLLLGELVIKRNRTIVPPTPVIDSASLLSYNMKGYDGKVIFHFDNDKAPGEPCYNLDIHASLFKLYAQQEGCEPILAGITTSWAGMYYNVPASLTTGTGRVRLGVASVSLDTNLDSETAWSEYITPPAYAYNDDIAIDKHVIKPGEDFTVYYTDPNHEEGVWSVIDSESGDVVASQSGCSITTSLQSAGTYTLRVEGMQYDGDAQRISTVRDYPGYIQVSDERVGALPEIHTLTAESYEVATGDTVMVCYTGRDADGACSQGIALDEQRFGARCSDLGVTGGKSFSLAFWLKINKLAEGATQLLSVADKGDPWPKTDWGWLWCDLDDTGAVSTFTFRGSTGTDNQLSYDYSDCCLAVGNWVHLAFVFDYNESGGLRGRFFVDGKERELKSWSRTTGGPYTDEPGYQGSVYKITSGQVLAIGGAAHGRSGLDGQIDNVMVWDKAITADEVLASMGDMEKEHLPSGLLALWDFESQADSTGCFLSDGYTSQQTAAGLHTYVASGSEGQGTLQWVAPRYDTGCPFLESDLFKVITAPSFEVSNGIVVAERGSDTSGSADLVLTKAGNHVVRLTLANAWGSDVREISLTSVGEYDAVSELDADMPALEVRDGRLVLTTAAAGHHALRLYRPDGTLLVSKEKWLPAGGAMTVKPARRGIFLVELEKDGRKSVSKLVF